MAEESTEIEVLQDGGMHVTNGNMKVNGNLEVTSQVTASGLKVLGDDHLPELTTVGGNISFRKACEFTKPVQFNGGKTIIGMESTYNSAYVGSQTIQAGDRLLVGDSLLKITSSPRNIVADTFKMSLATLNADTVVSKKDVSDLVQAVDAKVTNKLIAQTVYANTIKTNNLLLDRVQSREIQTSEELVAKDLHLTGSAIIDSGVTICGRTAANGAALVVNKGQIIANDGITSHTANNLFQTLQIFGSGEDNDICFHISPKVGSLIEGDVTIQNSKLVLDGSRLFTDNVTVTALGGTSEDEPTTGVQLTSSSSWETYRDGMVEEMNMPPAPDDGYDPVAQVQAAMERNEVNYRETQLQLKTILNPITYLMEQGDSQIPKRFNVKSGIYRIDGSGNALLRNLVSETGRFSKLDVFKFNVNRLSVDKLVTTAVASNVVHTDNLLKSEGIAEFDGVVNTNADVFIGGESRVNVADGAEITMQNGSSLVLKSGASLEMGSETRVKMGGDIELDFRRLVFVDPATGNKYRISFRDAHEIEGGGTVMEYEKVPEEEMSTPKEVADGTTADARELDEKLKSLGI